eukprot:6261698-Prymnesium_polylepis.1
MHKCCRQRVPQVQLDRMRLRPTADQAHASATVLGMEQSTHPTRQVGAAHLGSDHSRELLLLRALAGTNR